MPSKQKKKKKAEKPLWVQVMNALNARPDLRHDIVESLEDWRVAANAIDKAQAGGSRFAATVGCYGANSFRLHAAIVDAIRETIFEACGRKEEKTDALA